MKNKIVWLLIVASLILVAEVAVFTKKCDKAVNQPVSQPAAENNLQISINSISELDSFFNIKAEYPQFKDIDPVFNEKISALTTREIEQFKKDSKDNWQARKDTALPGEVVPENPPTPFDFIASWTPTQLNNKYLSFVINVYYFSGGAHGNEEVYTFNYDIAENKEISINDFLGLSQQNLEKLAQLASQEVTSQLQSSGMQTDNFLRQMIEQGTKPTQENFKDFNFSYNSLIIYFQKYQVAPGAAGSITITLYKDTLESNSIKSDYLK